LFFSHLLLNAFKSLNDAVNYKVYECLFEKSNALSIVDEYDVVLDCTDNVITRYLINDVCVLLNIPLVSCSALKFEGQVRELEEIKARFLLNNVFFFPKIN